MSVTEINPFFAMIKKNNYIKPIFKKLVLKRTQDLPKAFIDVGSFYFFNYNKIKKYNSLKNAKKILPYVVNFLDYVDVDEESDWEQLKIKYFIKKKIKIV